MSSKKLLPQSKIYGALLTGAVLLPVAALAQTTAPASATSGTTPTPTPTLPAPMIPIATGHSAPKEVIDRIRDEGMKRSQIMPTIEYLTDVIGARLTGSPALREANAWTAAKMTGWGLKNAHQEAWGPFGRGWTLENFDAQMVTPVKAPLIAYPKAWSPATKGTLTADVVYLDAQTEADLVKYHGKLKGKIVLISPLREIKADFDPPAKRRNDENIASLVAAPDPALLPKPKPVDNDAAYKTLVFTTTRLNFLKREGASLIVDSSSGSGAGTLFVLGASAPQPVPANAAAMTGRTRLQPYQKAAERTMVPQMTMGTENYNRLLRVIQNGITPKLSVNIGVKYYDSDPMAYNTIAEIPGTDLKDEVVMIGGHLDSWHGATGATDNAAGVGVAMEAVRILQTLGLKPRRTIRVGLWTGEEHGLFGSEAYVKAHYGEVKTGADGTKQLVTKPEYDKLAAYYNLDGGTGKIRGMFSQGNLAGASIFREWLQPFADFGANNVTLANTGSTDHISFDAVALPGFQFIQDSIEYGSRTHHSNQDTFDRVQAEDMKQSAVIMAAFAYQTAMMDERFPREAFTP